MELPHLGEHCSLESCNQLDFLPFTCDACKKIFCKEHHKYESHYCLAAQNKDRRVPVCPLCNQPISLSSTESVDQKVNEHIENYCKSDLAKHKRSNRCKVKGCKQRELIPVLCSSCKQNYCLRHRHEKDHDCPGNSSRHPYQGAPSILSGQAALARANKNPKNTTAPRQTKLTTSSNRSRNNQQQRPSPRLAPTQAKNHLQARNLTEDEALALALQASLAESSFPSGTQAKQEPTATNREDDDLAFARALAESEKDERERQRRLNVEQSQKSKDSCSIS